VQGGLAAALEEVAERLPLAIDLSAGAARATPAVEATAYFVACEALTNTVKHAQASRATVAVRIGAAGLEMDITDDGVGGADRRGLRSRPADQPHLFAWLPLNPAIAVRAAFGSG
jgi:signal transduction histidine kinase